MAPLYSWFITIIATMISQSLCAGNTTSPIITPIALSHAQRVDFLHSVNTARSSASKGQGVLFGGGSPSRYQISTAMESMIWDHALSLTASTHSNRCTYSYSNITLRADSYFNVYSNDRMPVVDPSDIYSVGETIYEYPIDTASDGDYDIDSILGSAITSWIDGCSQWLYFSMSCRDGGHDVECTNCLQFLAERTRYIGCALSLCSDDAVFVVCNYYYGTTTVNLMQNGAFVPYFDGTANGICSGCTFTDRPSCDLSIGLCTGCPSLNFDVCSYSNSTDLTVHGIDCTDYLTADDADCDIDGLFTLNPTVDPTASPTLSPSELLSPLDTAHVLELMNSKRSDVANGNVLSFGATPIYAKNMESLLWDEALSIVAAHSILNIYGNATNFNLSGLYKENEQQSSVVLSDRLENIKVGTTSYLHRGHAPDDIARDALDSWITECTEYFVYGESCDGLDDASKCANCLQLIWSKTRYTGCAVDRCSSTNDVIFLCHYYWSAQLSNGDDFGGISPWTLPFDFGISDNDICSSCTDTERDECDDANLCGGCPDSNHHQCSTDMAFNGQRFGNEGCAMNPVDESCVDTAPPSMTPTAAPSDWLTSWNRVQIQTVLNTANSIRSNVANGMYSDGINTNGVEQWIWNEALSVTAYCTASQCNNDRAARSDAQELALRFVAANDGSASRLVLPDDVGQIRVGETVYIYEGDEYSVLEIDAILSKALYEWVGDCRSYDAMSNECSDDGDGVGGCSECVQMLWSETRYIGCGYEQCGEGVIEVVCHYYYGAGEVGVDMPLSFGTVCSGCEERPDRNECEESRNLCFGCPADNFETCWIAEGECAYNEPSGDCEDSGITRDFYEQS